MAEGYPPTRLDGVDGDRVVILDPPCYLRIKPVATRGRELPVHSELLIQLEHPDGAAPTFQAVIDTAGYYSAGGVGQRGSRTVPLPDGGVIRVPAAGRYSIRSRIRNTKTHATREVDVSPFVVNVLASRGEQTLELTLH